VFQTVADQQDDAPSSSPQPDGGGRIDDDTDSASAVPSFHAPATAGDGALTSSERLALDDIADSNFELSQRLKRSVAFIDRPRSLSLLQVHVAVCTGY